MQFKVTLLWETCACRSSKISNVGVKLKKDFLTVSEGFASVIQNLDNAYWLTYLLLFHY